MDLAIWGDVLASADADGGVVLDLRPRDTRHAGGPKLAGYLTDHGAFTASGDLLTSRSYRRVTRWLSSREPPPPPRRQQLVIRRKMLVVYETFWVRFWDIA